MVIKCRESYQRLVQVAARKEQLTVLGIPIIGLLAVLRLFRFSSLPCAARSALSFTRQLNIPLFLHFIPEKVRILPPSASIPIQKHCNTKIPVALPKLKDIVGIFA